MSRNTSVICAANVLERRLVLICQSREFVKGKTQVLMALSKTDLSDCSLFATCEMTFTMFHMVLKDQSKRPEDVALGKRGSFQTLNLTPLHEVGTLIL